MESILTTIGQLEECLCRYLDGLASGEESDEDTRLSQAEKKQRVVESCHTLSGKFEMLCHNVAMMSRLGSREAKIKSKATNSVEIRVSEHQKHRIILPEDQLDRTNIICSFYNMVNVSASFRDALTKLVIHVYGETLQEIDQEKDIDFEKPSPECLARVLGSTRPLGAKMQQFFDENQWYKLVISLRNKLEHESVMGVLSYSGDGFGQRPNFNVHAKWSPTGETCSVADYAKSVYRVSVELITSMCDCIMDDPDGCVEEIKSA